MKEMLLTLMLGVMLQIPIGGITESNASKSVLATDNFTQADENPLSSGGNWHTISGYDTFQVVSHLASASSNSALNVEYYDASISWPNDQFVKITLQFLVGLVPEQDIGPMCRSNQTTTYYAARAITTDGTTFSVSLLKYVGGSLTSLGSTSAVFVNGDTLEIDCQGTTLKVQHNGSVVSALTTTDNAISSGKPGIWGYTADNSGWAETSQWLAGACNGAC